LLGYSVAWLLGYSVAWLLGIWVLKAGAQHPRNLETQKPENLIHEISKSNNSLFEFVYLYTMRNFLLFITICLGFLYLSSCKDDDVEPDKPILPDYSVNVKLNHLFNGASLQLDKEIYGTANEDTVSVSRWVYHINSFKFFGADGTVNRPNDYFLVDAEEPASTILSLDSLENIAFDSVQFTIGVQDSVVSADGLLNEKFLDPMYWGMINGYINMKLEGRSSSVTSDSVYLLHIGGYMGDYKLARTVTLDFKGSTLRSRPGNNNLTINVDLAEYFKNPNVIDIGVNNRIHSPTDSAKAISENWPSMFGFGSIN
jgi:hypothetical protein